MDPSLMHHQRNSLENMDMNQFQGNATKLNPGVLRGIESSTLHFIAIPRNSESEYIDQTLLSTEYLATHIQNGLVVDIQSQSQPPPSGSSQSQQNAIGAHNIYGSSDGIDSNGSPLEMTTERHFIAGQDVSAIPMDSIQHALHQSNHSMHQQQHHHPHHHRSNHQFEQSSNGLDRKVIISEPGRHQYILTNEAPVIVSSKEVAAAMTMNDLDLANSFPNTFSQMDHTMLQEITKTSPSPMDEHDLDEENQTLPPLPPLTPISKLQTIRKTSPTQIEQQQQQQHAIPYKNIIHTSASTINLPKSNTIMKNSVCFVTTADDEDMNFMSSNMKSLRQNNSSQHQQQPPQQQHCSTNAQPKKSLPHKKRITKKLKSISPNMDQMQAVDSTYQHHHSHQHQTHHHDISHSLQRLSTNHDEQSYSVVANHHHLHHLSHQQQQNETLNLTLNAQPIQLTTTRIDAHNQSVNGSDATTNQTEFITPDQFSSQMHQITMAESGITAAGASTIQTVARFACELCGMQAETQLSFYNHLKLHYEPDVPQNYKVTESVRNVQQQQHQQNTSAGTNINTSVLVLEPNDQHLYHLANGGGDGERKISVEAQCIAGQPIANAQPVIMSDSHSYVRVQNGGQDFSCISEIGRSDMGADNDDDAVDGDDASISYNDTGLVGIKSEQNEFSDTEDMLENGVLDKVQRVVDSYIENGTSDVKNLIDMNDQHHSNLVNNSCNWNAGAAAAAAAVGEVADTGGNAHSLSNNTVYSIDKHEPVGTNITANSFVITTTAAINQNKGTSHATVASVAQNHIINDGTVIARPEELTLIYEINVNDKDFPIIDDASSESILRRQLVRTEATTPSNHSHQFQSIETSDCKTVDLSMDRYITDTTPATTAITKINIQDEFIEEEHTDSDADPAKPDAQKKKRKVYRCKRCNKVCNSKNALHYHFLSHTGQRPHKCNECDKSFFASSALKVHKRLHSGDKPYNCDFCNRPFRQWGDLKYHIQSKHSTARSHQCEFCGKDFARRYSLVIHRRIHTGEKNYKCEFCDKEFRASSYLQVHRKIHTGEKPFVCDACGKRFRVRGDLKRHSNIHERNNKSRDMKLDDMSNGSSNGNKNELFILDDTNNTLQSRSTDTLDQLVSVIESTNAALANNDNNSGGGGGGVGDNLLKKRNFMHIGYEKSFSKAKYKRDFRTMDVADDCSSSDILDYSADHLMDKELAFEKSRIRHDA